MLSICRQQVDGVSKKVVNPDVLGTGNKATIKLLLQRFRVSRRNAEEGSTILQALSVVEGLRNIQRLMKICNPKLEKAKV